MRDARETGLLWDAQCSWVLGSRIEKLWKQTTQLDVESIKLTHCKLLHVFKTDLYKSFRRLCGMMTKSTCIATVHLVHLGGGGSLKTFIKVVKLNERLLHINEHYNVYTLNAFITSVGTIMGAKPQRDFLERYISVDPDKNVHRPSKVVICNKSMACLHCHIILENIV